MVSQVTLGNFFTTTSGKNVLGGIGGSGLDTKSLIEGLTKARSAPADIIKDKITVNDDQSTALATFNALLSNFQSALDALRNPPGVGNDADNVFKFASASIISNTSVSGLEYVSVTTSPGATIQNYTITDITSIAAAARQTSGSFTIEDADESVVAASSTPGLFTAGTITINSQDITLEEDDSLNTVVSKFNAVKDTTGIAATIIKVGDDDFKISFVATETGDDGDFDLAALVDPDGVLDNIGLGAAVGGTNAEFKLNGISIERQSNSISDVINNVTFDLLQETPNSSTVLTVRVQPSTTTIQNSIVNFVTTYNAIRTFATEQTQLNSDGTYAETAVLANNQTFRNAINSIFTQINTQVTGLDDDATLTSLSDLGITFTTQPADDDSPEVTNILNVNDGLLSSLLATDFNAVAKVFGFFLSSDNANLKVYQQLNTLGVTNFRLEIDPDTETFSAFYDLGSGEVEVELTATAIDDYGYTLVGPADSAIEGLTLIYASTDAATIEVTASQGVASILYNTTDAISDPYTGTVVVELETLKDSNTSLQEDIDKINAQVALFQEQLIKQFAALEQAISRVNQLLNALAANDDARIAAGGS